MRKLPLIAVFAAVPTIALAISVVPADNYFDVRFDSPEAPGINMLTAEGVVQGYGGRRFGPTRAIKRAEFVKIAMEAKGVDGFIQSQFTSHCFPDVKASDWFSFYACLASQQGIIDGKTFPNRYGGRSYFDPGATVTYGEALKILTLVFEYDITQINAAHWAEPYYRAAAEHKVDLPITIDLDRPLTRGLAARLAAAFVAENYGLLADLRLAESGIYPSSNSSSRSSSSSSSRSSSSMSSSSSSVSTQPLDPLSDTTVRSQFLLLGEVGPVIGAGKIFLETEPLDAASVTINLTTEIPTVRSLLVYDETKHLLGRATLDPSASTNRAYKVELPIGRFHLNKAEERSVYVRPELSSRENGGQSNLTVQVANIIVKGTGEWSSGQYTSQATGADAYPMFVTSRATITSVTNAGAANAALITGSDRELGRFTFTGRKTDALAHIDVTDLMFTIQQTGGVSISNPALAVDGITERFPCTAGSTSITCINIPETYGSATDAPRTIRVYGTITAADTAHASLQLVLNEGGDPTHAGAITWTDGSTSFSWMPVSGAIANGTHYTY